PRSNAHILYRLLFIASLLYLMLIHIVLLIYFGLGYELTLERVRHGLMVFFGSKPIHDLTIYFPLVVLPLIMVFAPLLKRLFKRVMRNKGMSRLGILFVSLMLIYAVFPQQNRILKDAPFVGVSQPLRTLAKDAMFKERPQHAPTGKVYTPPAQVPLSQDAYGIKHVALIILESVSSEAVNHQVNGEYVVAPFLQSLKDKAVVFGDSITVIPGTSKSLISMLCGIYPFVSHFAFESLTVPGTCLPKLLNEHQFDSVFFRASTEYFDNHSGIHRQTGFKEVVSPEKLLSDNQDVTYTSFAGVDERDVLPKMSSWLNKRKNGKTFATLLTNVSHAPYALPKDIPEVRLADAEMYNKYLNTVKFSDGILERIFDVYKKQGLFDDALFVIIGDHGESFGEHSQYGHLYSVYQNTISVPLVIYNERLKLALKTPVSDAFYSGVDVLPTIADALNIQHEYKVGYSVLSPLPERLIFSSEITSQLSASVIDGDRKFIHYFGFKRDDYFDLATDPREMVNRIDQLSEEEIAYYKNAIHEWKHNVQHDFDAHFKATLGSDYYMKWSTESLPCTFKDIMVADALNASPKEWLRKCKVTSDRHHGH
ncbi:MAG: sulfatase-like hydrolase/transferase, partial [Pseudomonadota bacterium]